MAHGSVGLNHLTRVLLTIVFLFGALLWPSFGHADSLEINVEQVKVYGAPDEESDVIFTLFKGDSVPLSKKSVPNYKKVLIQDGGQKRVGYIKNSELTRGGAKTKPQKNQPKSKLKGLAGHVVLGLTGGGNYQYQGARTYTDTASATASISALSGFSTLFGAFVDYPFSERFSVSGYFQYKKVSVTGTASYSLTTIPNVATDTFLKETFLVFGALLKFYPNRNGSWWFGGGAQVDKATAGTLKFGGFPEGPLENKDLPTFTYVYAAIGANFPLFGKFYFMPDLRFGVLLVSNPLIIEADIIGNIGYSF
ncbi:MAG: hypothetical protein SGI74_03930 [Oligoflexia bacterium]|nr:hypothetical protein [Oligoflexia bacterium]